MREIETHPRGRDLAEGDESSPAMMELKKLMFVDITRSDSDDVATVELTELGKNYLKQFTKE